MNEEDKKIKDWLDERATTRAEADGDRVNRLLRGDAVYVLVQLVMSGDLSKKWTIIESKAVGAVFSKEDAEEISRRVSKISNAVQVAVIGVNPSSIRYGPKWGHPIASQRAEKITQGGNDAENQSASRQ